MKQNRKPGIQINKRQFKQWIAALDSGEYKQTDCQLQDENGYCCLGVGCKVIIPVSMLWAPDGILRGVVPASQPAAPTWLKDINDDFEDKTSRSLSELNDSEGFTFPEIATLLELVYIHKILD